MVCTYCGSETRVSNSRHQKRANNVWRRRKCLQCDRIFSTIEQVDYERSWLVLYADGSERPFLRDRLLTSLYKSLQHRPTALPDAIGLTATIIGKLGRTIQDGGVTSTAIGAITYLSLQRFEATAAIFYAAYHPNVL